MEKVNLLVVLFCFLFSAFYIVYSWLEDKNREKKMRKRIESLGFSVEGIATALSKGNVKVSKESILEKKLNRMLSANKAGENVLLLKLYRCGLNMSLKTFAQYLLAIWFTVLFITLFNSSLSLLYNILISFGATLLLIYFGCNFLENRRKKKIVIQLSAAVDIILRGIKAGGSIEKTFEIVAREVNAPLENEFKQINREIDFGVAFEKAMHRAAARINIDEFYFFTSALIIQRKSGGSLIDVLENIITSLNRNKEIRAKIKIHASEAQVSGYVLSFLPAIVWVVLEQIKPENIEFFYNDPLGQKFLYIAIGLFISAFIIIKRLVNLEV